MREDEKDTGLLYGVPLVGPHHYVSAFTQTQHQVLGHALELLLITI